MKHFEHKNKVEPNSKLSIVMEQHHGYNRGGSNQNVEHDDLSQKPSHRKPLAFHMSFLALMIMGFICALDGTVLGVALPVRLPYPLV